MLQTYWRRWCLRLNSKLLIHSKEAVHNVSLPKSPALPLATFPPARTLFSPLKEAILSHLLAFLHLMNSFWCAGLQVNVSSLGKFSCTLIFKTGLGDPFRGSFLYFLSQAFSICSCCVSVAMERQTFPWYSWRDPPAVMCWSCLVLAHKSPPLHFQDFSSQLISLGSLKSAIVGTFPPQKLAYTTKLLLLLLLLVLSRFSRAQLCPTP